jgi:AGCS family alanine or glycine:cation symporter
MSIDATIDQYFAPLADTLSTIVFYSIPVLEGVEAKLILIWLVVAALFFTLYLGFINLRYFFHAINIVRGKFDDGKPKDGQISSFQALMTSMAATVGLGNIAGVAVAISLGGPGAAFWMLIMGLFGMSIKFAEVMCGVKYRHHPDPDRPHEIFGGPMYYIRDAFANRNIPYLGRFFALMFALFCSLGALGAAALFQTNQTFQQLLNISGGPESYFADKAWLFGIFMVIISGFVIIGGIKVIANVSSKIVPLMAILYIAMGLVVIALNIASVPAALMAILQGALLPEAGFGALVGSLLIGVQRATFSNEAGLGSAAVSQSCARTDSPVEQGFVGMLGPFIDTVIVCMVTAIVIVLTGAYQTGSGIEGVELTSRAFESAVSWFPYLLAAVVFLFAYSTIIGWYYIGEKGFCFLFGERIWIENIYKAIFCVFIVIGAAAQLDSVIAFTDAMVLAMAIPNVIGLYLLAPEIKRDLKAYIAKIRT